MKYCLLIIVISQFMLHSNEITIVIPEAGYENSKIFIDDYLKQFINAGWEINQMILPDKRAENAIITGKAEAILFKEKNYGKKIMGMTKLDTPFVTSTMQLFFRKDTEIIDITDVKGLKLVSLKNIKLNDLFITLLKPSEIITVKDIDIMFKFVAYNKADFTIYNYKLAKKLLLEMGIESDLSFIDLPEARMEFYLWIRNEHSTIIEEFNKIIEANIKTGVYIPTLF